jgi:hypothetical protein
MRRKKDFMLQNVGGKDLLVPLGAQVMDTNALITLNPTGRHVWELLAEDRSVDEMAAAVVEKFDVELDRAQVDVQAFLDEITGMGLVEQ